MDNDEVKNEASAEEWLAPSGIGGEYMRHEQAVLKAAKVPVHKAFAIAPGFNVGMLQKLADNYKPKKIVVIEHGENGFEVRRLADSADVKLFYASLNPQPIAQTYGSAEDTQRNEVLRIIKDFFQSTEDSISKYDAKGVEAKRMSCVTASYIQRRLAGTAAFKGSTNSLKEIYAKLEQDGLIKKLSKEETEEFFNSTANFYRVVIEML
jgi:hypothetical protein